MSFENYESCKSKIAAIAHELKASGLEVELEISESIAPKVRLRLVNKNFVGEIVIWDTGDTFQIVLDSAGETVLSRDGLNVRSMTFEASFAKFFAFFNSSS